MVRTGLNHCQPAAAIESSREENPRPPTGGSRGSGVRSAATRVLVTIPPRRTCRPTDTHRTSRTLLSPRPQSHTRHTHFPETKQDLARQTPGHLVQTLSPSRPRSGPIYPAFLHGTVGIDCGTATDTFAYLTIRRDGASGAKVAPGYINVTSYMWRVHPGR